MHYLGIDWASDKHDLCLMADDGRLLTEFSITHDMQGFLQLQAALQASPRVRINIERSDGLLVDWLMAQGYDVYMTPPNVLAHRRPRRSKDDRGDAYLLAYLLRIEDLDCRPIPRQSLTVQHLKQLAMTYDLIVREQRRLANRLLYTLQQYFPAALQAFYAPHSLIGLAFLEAYPTPQAAQALSQKQLETFLRNQRYSYMDRLPKIYATLQEPAPFATMDCGHTTALRVLIPLLRTLFHERVRLTRQLAAVFDSHPLAPWLRSFPGTNGPLTAARLLAWMGDDPGRFPSPQVLQAVAGTVPVTRHSNKQHSVEFRHACSHPLRQAIDDLARQSIRHSGWANAYFHDQLARGHAKPRAYRALANRWLGILWKLWQTKMPYDEAKHVANRAGKGHPLPLVPMSTSVAV
jgi:transposase